MKLAGCTKRPLIYQDQGKFDILCHDPVYSVSKMNIFTIFNFVHGVISVILID